MQIHSVGIDLGKTTFHLVALDDHGKVLLKKKSFISTIWSSRSDAEAIAEAVTRENSLQVRCDVICCR